MRGWGAAAVLAVAAAVAQEPAVRRTPVDSGLGAAAASSAAGAHGARLPLRGWDYQPSVTGVPVTDRDGQQMIAPWLGGFDVPRPQLVDINGTGHPALFVQEWAGQIAYFERVNNDWVFRTDHYEDLDVGQWFRFVDLDGDGRIDLLGEMPQGYIRMWRNIGTRTAPRFSAPSDTIRDVDGVAILADRQNILNAIDIDCNGKLDLFIGRVQGTVDRFEQDGAGADGTPRFRMITPNWEGIEILGPEATQGSAISRPISDTGIELENAGEDATRHAAPGDARPARASFVTGAHGARRSARHGANTLTFADLTGKGVLDLFWGDFFEPGLLQIENSGTCALPNLQNKPVEFPPAHPVITSGYNAPTFGDVDGDGNIDLIMGVIGGAYGPSRTSIENLYFMPQSPKGSWAVRTKRLISQIDVGSEAIPALGDLRGTGTLDLLIGSKVSPSDPETGTVTWFENIGTRTAPVFRERGELPITGQFNYAPAIVDLDGDSLPDLVMGTWREHLRWYRNTGTRTDPKWTLADTALVTIPRGSNTRPAFGDIDGDGLIDVMIGAASGRLLLYRNTGTRNAPSFSLVNANFQDIKFGRRSAPALADMNGDGRPDLLIGNENGDLQLWLNTGARGEFRFALDSTFKLQSLPGASPAIGDLHGTGHPDIVVGTSAGGIRWFGDKR